MQLTGLGLAALLLGAPLIVGSAYVPDLARLGWGWMAVVVVVALTDGLIARASARLEAHREVETPLSRGVQTVVRIGVRNRSRWACRLQIKDSPPLSFETPDRLLRVTLAPLGEGQAMYQSTPTSRGDFSFGDVFLRGSGRLRLSTWQRRLRVETDVSVYPSLAGIDRYERLTRRHRLSELGLRATRGRKESTYFESLRDYVADDDYRDIDWKATARRGHPVTRQYQAERGQTVMLLLDTGRMMAARVGDASKLDLATEAALMLAHVAAARQDAVGMMAFGREVLSFIPPDKRAGQVGRILEGLYRLQPTLDEPDYAAAFSLLAGKARKRALVVVFTDLVDTDTSERLLAHVSALCPRHLPLLVALRDPDLERLANCVPVSVEEAYQRAIAGQVLARREEAILALRHRGAVVVDAAAGAFTVSAVDRYLELKETARL